MESYLPENEYKEVEGRAYLNPQVAVDESNTFIDNLRASQNRQNQEISTDTQRLGTNVPSNLGGLIGADSYFTSRYQTPQTNSAVANLRAAAQANALNQILQDEQAMWKKKYQDTYRDYQKRQYRKAYGGGSRGGSYGGSSGGSSGGSGGGDGGNISTWNGEVETQESPTREFYGVPGADVSETDTHYVYTDQNTGEKVYVSKDYMNKIYDKNGNITDDGAVILDTRRMLGL